MRRCCFGSKDVRFEKTFDCSVVASDGADDVVETDSRLPNREVWRDRRAERAA